MEYYLAEFDFEFLGKDRSTFRIIKANSKEEATMKARDFWERYKRQLEDRTGDDIFTSVFLDNLVVHEAID